MRCTRLAAPHLFSSRDVTLREDPAEWTAVARSLGVPADRLLLVKQVHGIHVAVARRGESTPWPRPQADILAKELDACKRLKPTLLDREGEYTVIFEEGEANWSAYVPDLPGCVAAAATREETELLVAEAIALHLELIREDGDPIPQPRSTVKLASIRA